MFVMFARPGPWKGSLAFYRPFARIQSIIPHCAARTSTSLQLCAYTLAFYVGRQDACRVCDADGHGTGYFRPTPADSSSAHEQLQSFKLLCQAMGW